MTISSVTVVDETNPVELTTWFAANPSVTIKFLLNDGRTFFIFY